MSTFFADIRQSIEAGTFEECRELFERTYESELPEGTGQRPRARGYHFKSEGKGEPKRNKPAWGALGGDEDENGDERMVVEGEGEDDESGNGDETPALVPEGDARELEEKGFAEPMER